MHDQTLNTFRFVVGAARPIRLAVRRPDSRAPDVVEIDSPCAVIGRAPNCHICLPAEDVSYRHAYLQVVGGRIACIDLFSSGGIRWDGDNPGPWLSPQHRIQIGETWLQLFDDGWSYEPDLPSPLDYRPRSEQRPEFGVLPEVELELVNSASKGTRWPINRVITLVGRDERCRITCANDQISKVHCSLLLAPSGLWVVDLLGRDGVRVNGEQTPFGYLQDESELQVGKYIMRARYPQLAAARAAQAAPPPAAASGTGRPSPAFLTRQHQVFPVEEAGDTLVVVPQGDIRDFFYQDIHLESNRVVHILQQYQFANVVVDYSQVKIVGSIVLDAVAAFCRAARGGAAQCAADPEMLSILQTMNFTSIWPHYPTRDEAVQAVRLRQAKAAAT
jgi:pSer/pThr/pTyr-binding forkhead associated (FHA) protein/anti-anti-sigma regulatory factor